MVTISGDIMALVGLVLSVCFFAASAWLSVSASKRLREIRDQATEIERNVDVLRRFSDKMMGRLLDQSSDSLKNVQEIVRMTFDLIERSGRYSKQEIEANRRLATDFATASTAIATVPWTNRWATKSGASFVDLEEFVGNALNQVEAATSITDPSVSVSAPTEETPSQTELK
jgi:hypothetical protein